MLEKCMEFEVDFEWDTEFGERNVMTFGAPMSPFLIPWTCCVLCHVDGDHGLYGSNGLVVLLRLAAV